MNSTIILANWLFVMGSTLFTLDAVIWLRSFFRRCL